MQKQNNQRRYRILIASMGGQGGGFIGEGIRQAAEDAGFQTLGVSLPGLAQRGGEVTYYVEFAVGFEKILLSPYPVEKEIDVLIGQELLEAARYAHYGSFEKTVAICDINRRFALAEKVSAGGSYPPQKELEERIKRHSRTYISVPAQDICKKLGISVQNANAVLLGVLAGSNALPLKQDNFLRALRESKVAGKEVTEAFEAGLRYSFFSIGNTEPLRIPYKDIDARLACAGYTDMPVRIKRLLYFAMQKLTEYQDEQYAERYLKMVISLLRFEKDISTCIFAEHVVKHLANWMGYEDAFRVAYLKTQPNRFKTILAEAEYKAGEVVEVVDYLKPDAEELYGLLPRWFVDAWAAMFDLLWSEKLFGERDAKRFAYEQKIVSSSVVGFLKLWILSKLSFMRPYSWRFHHEWEAINEYVGDIEWAGVISYDLACSIAESARLVKGYGGIRRDLIGIRKEFVAFVKDCSSKERQEKAKKVLSCMLAHKDGIEKGFAEAKEKYR
ncbi:MAG: 2-oxoacid:acceptor oxidoreductase family protein [Candidatus Niyogibacteria bacterium]|nr:2-oxoacid:acceptor oxidoreductase family protein [Candidatus Niyogibacteria bacterium]